MGSARTRLLTIGGLSLLLAWSGACQLVAGLDDPLVAGDAGGPKDAPVDVGSPESPSPVDARVEASPGDGRASDAKDARSTDTGDGVSEYFFDDFNRANSATIGNGWIAKQPAFEIFSDALRRIVDTSDGHAGYDYVDLILYRPGAGLLDVKATVEVRFSDASQALYPQIHTRVQTATVTVAGQLDSYLLYAGGFPTSMTLARQAGGEGSLTTLSTFGLSTPFDTMHDFRMSLTTIGTSTVTVSGEVEVYDTSAASWQSVGSATVDDSDPSRIAQQGTMGLSASTQDLTRSYVYDNFTVYEL